MKMNESHFPWNWVLFILSSIMLAVVAYDFSSSPTIQGIFMSVCMTVKL